jgi:hypothetical protein
LKVEETSCKFAKKIEEINNPEKQQNLKFIPVLMTSASVFLHRSTTVHHTFTRKGSY